MSVIDPATWLNAGMANRQEDAGLRKAQVSAPLRTLALLGLAEYSWIYRSEQRSEVQRPVTEQVIWLTASSTPLGQ